MMQSPSRALVYSADISSTAGDINGNWDTIRNCRFAHDAVAAESIEDMVQALERLRGPYTFITLCGHAAEGNQSIGGTYDEGKKAQGELLIRSADDYQPKYDFVTDHLQDVLPFLQRLKALMKDEGVLFLAGCSVAKGSQGRNLLRQISAQMPKIWVVGIEQETTEQAVKSKTYIEIAKANEAGKLLGSITEIDLVMAYNGKIMRQFPSTMSTEEMLQGMTKWEKR